jgi:hypothetical protein
VLWQLGVVFTAAIPPAEGLEDVEREKQDAVKVAVTVRAWVIVRVQERVPLQPSPLQPVKVDPVSA